MADSWDDPNSNPLSDVANTAREAERRYTSGETEVDWIDFMNAIAETAFVEAWQYEREEE